MIAVHLRRRYLMLSRNRLLVLLLMLAVWVGSFGSGESQGLPSSRYVRNQHSEKVIIFVHGLFGDSVQTWSNGSSYWPDLIVKDHTFDGFDVFVYQYPTSINATLTPDELAGDMRVVLKSNGVSDRQKLIFISHSMGGVVTRDYLLKNQDVAKRTIPLQFCGTPTDGSFWAALGTALLNHALFLSQPQLEKLKAGVQHDYLGDQIRNWGDANLNIPSYCAYETRDTFFGVRVVEFESATHLCSHFNAVDSNHIEMVKPKDEESRPYMIFKANFLQTLANQAELPPIPKTDSLVHGWLKPANYPTPANGCDRLPHSPDMTKVLIGDNAIGFEGYRETIVLRIKECPALVIKRTNQGVLLDAVINDGAGISPVIITNNEIVAENGETYSAVQSADESTILVTNRKTGKVLLDAQFLNATTIRVRGKFGCLGGRTIDVKDDQPIPGHYESGSCYVNNMIGIWVN